MWEILGKAPWRLFSFARVTTKLHAEMHSRKIQANLPFQVDRLEYKIRHAKALSSRLQKATLSTLFELPNGDSLCHGDFHPLNILLSIRGPVIIDWITSSIGNPLADLARSTIIILGAASSTQIPKSLEKFIVRWFHSTYIRHYFQLRPRGEMEYRHWLLVVAAVRLSEKIPEVEQWLLKQVEIIFIIIQKENWYGIS
jgi:aminoglycoside phosphotransferase (APT) family kinase protein